MEELGMSLHIHAEKPDAPTLRAEEMFLPIFEDVSNSQLHQMHLGEMTKTSEVSTMRTFSCGTLFALDVDLGGYHTTLVFCMCRCFCILQLHSRFPKLKIVFEHISTAAAVKAIKGKPNVAASITAHHLRVSVAFSRSF